MDKSYRFISEIEPTDEQLEGLMLAVLRDVKERATMAEEKFKNFQIQQIKTAFEEWHLKNGN